MPARGRAGAVARRRAQRDGEAEARAAPELAVDADLAVHQLDQVLGDRQAEPRAAARPARPVLGLVERVEHARRLGGRDPDPGILDAQRQPDPLGRDLGQHDLDQDLAAVGVLDGVADQVDQHLAQLDRIAAQPGGHVLGDEAHELQALALAGVAEQVADLGDHLAGIEVDLEQVDVPGLDLGEVEHVVDGRQQGLAGAHQVLDQPALALVERRRRQQVRHAEHAVHRRADLVAHGRQELRLGEVRRLGLLARAHQIVCDAAPPVDLGRQVQGQLVLAPGEARRQGRRADQYGDDRDHEGEPGRRQRHARDRRVA